MAGGETSEAEWHDQEEDDGETVDGEIGSSHTAHFSDEPSAQLSGGMGDDQLFLGASADDFEDDDRGDLAA